MSGESKYILGIETATATCSVAVITQDKVLAEHSINTGNNHEPALLPMIERVLSESGIRLSMLTDIAVSTGPGSFTGLRIGIATAKALALASRKPLLGIPTLDGLSYNIGHISTPVCPMLDARRGEIYTALYKYEGQELRKLSPYMVLPLEELLEKITETTIFVGDTNRETIEKKLGDKAGFAPLHMNHPKAASIAFLGLLPGSSSEVNPIYLRKPRAEEQLITLDEMKDEDIAQVMQIEKESFPSPWSEEMFRDRYGGAFVVARLQERIVGYAAGLLADDELHLGNIAIHKDFRERGIAKKILYKIIDIAHSKKMKSIYLEVREGNAPAQNLYRKFGFKHIEKRDGYYRDKDEDAIIMTLNL